MKNRELIRQKDRLDSLFQQLTIASSGDAELQSHWARYLCVIVSGFLENAVEVLLVEYTSKRASEEIIQFVSRELGQFQNPKFGKIADVLGMFSSEWKKNVDVLTSEEIKDAVNSVVNNRHQIAHGQSTGISLATIRQYYDRIVIVVADLESRIIV